MNENDIECPKCGHKILIDEVLKRRMNGQINSEVSKRLELEKQKIEDELKNKYAAEQSDELKIIKEKLKFETEKRAEAQTKELNFIKKQNELEDKLKDQEIEIARRMQEEKKLLQEKSQVDAEEKFKLIIAEKDKKLEEQKKLNDEMNRKLHQGSMQTQGEVMELSFEEALKKNFLHDRIEPVPKGFSGVDVIQKVIHVSGQIAGLIAWETKRTKTWEDGWVEKAKDDARNVKADICVIVSDNLPKNIKYMGEYKGIWVCNFASAIGVSGLLRHGIIAKFNTVLVNTGKDEKKEAIYDYLCSQSFKQKVDIIIENSQKFLEIIETEKRWMTKKWAAQETRIRRLQDNTLKMYGEVQGIAGSSLPELELMELEDPEINPVEDKKNEQETKKAINEGQANLF